MSQPVSSPTLATIPLDVPQPVRTAEPKAAVCVPRHVAIVPECASADTAHWINALAYLIDVCLTDGVANLSVLVWDGRENDAAVLSRLQGLTDWIRSNASCLALRGVKLHALGEVHAQSRELVAAFREGPQAANATLNVHIAIGYNGRSELAGAVRALARESVSNGVNPSGITVEQLKNHLSSRALPPVDLLIRTDGRTQLSDFLLWQTAYAELLFLDTSWGAMRAQQFRQALADYARRRRTFGGLANGCG